MNQRNDTLLDIGSFRQQNHPPPERHDYCPKFCDEYGNLHKHKYCISPPFCCLKDDFTLGCCKNYTKKIPDEIEDFWNCRNFAQTWWMVTVSFAVAIITFMLLCYFVMCICQMSKRHQAQQHMRLRRQSNRRRVVPYHRRVGSRYTRNRLPNRNGPRNTRESHNSDSVGISRNDSCYSVDGELQRNRNNDHHQGSSSANSAFQSNPNEELELESSGHNLPSSHTGHSVVYTIDANGRQNNYILSRTVSTSNRDQLDFVTIILRPSRDSDESSDQEIVQRTLTLRDDTDDCSELDTNLAISGPGIRDTSGILTHNNSLPGLHDSDIGMHLNPSLFLSDVYPTDPPPYTDESPPPYSE